MAAAHKSKREALLKLPKLYLVARKIVNQVSDHKNSAKNLIFSAKYPIKGALTNLVNGTLENLPVLDALTKSVVLPHLPSIDPNTARVLLFQLLFGTGVLPEGTQKVQVIKSLFPKLKQELSQLELPSSIDNDVRLPRYVRVNTLKITVKDAIHKLKAAGFEYLRSRRLTYEQYLTQIQSLEPYQFIKDKHVKSMLVFHPDQQEFTPDLIPEQQLLQQNKSSCLATLALSPPPGSIVLDACAAPGMKTTHLAALMEDTGKIIALDLIMDRVQMLQNVLNNAGVTCCEVDCKDFTSINPKMPPYSEVEYILLDPSCSGSGMPSRALGGTKDDAERLQSLSNFQCKMLKHAMYFPKVKRIVYSTCSVFEKENEEVIRYVMRSSLGPQFDLVEALPEWPRRSETEPLTLRCSLREDLCAGFFVAILERNDS